MGRRGFFAAALGGLVAAVTGTKAKANPLPTWGAPLRLTEADGYAYHLDDGLSLDPDEYEESIRSLCALAKTPNMLRHPGVRTVHGLLAVSQ